MRTPILQYAPLWNCWCEHFIVFGVGGWCFRPVYPTLPQTAAISACEKKTMAAERGFAYLVSLARIQWALISPTAVSQVS